MLVSELLYWLLLSISYVENRIFLSCYMKLILGRSSRSLTVKSCNKTCENGGQCYIDEQRGSQARCSCPNEYYGSRCEHSMLLNLMIFRNTI